MIRCQIVTCLEEMFHYKEEWNILFESGNHEVSTSFEWTDALLSTHLSKKDSAFILILTNLSETIGIIPLVLRKRKKWGITINILSPVSDYYNTHSDLLIKYYSEEVIEAILLSLYKSNINWDILKIKDIATTNHLLHILECYLNKHSLNYKLEDADPSFFINLSNSYQQYLMSRSAKFRRELKRQERKIAKLGSFRVVHNSEFKNGFEAYQQLLNIERKSWKHTLGTAISSVKRQEKFYSKLFEDEFYDQCVHLLFLKFNDTPIAYNFGLIKNNKYFYLKTSYDENYKKLGPGVILRVALINDLILRKIKIVDFLSEPYQWERQWADNLQKHKSLLICANTTKAKLFSTYKRISDIRKTKKASDKIDYYNPLDVKP